MPTARGLILLVIVALAAGGGRLAGVEEFLLLAVAAMGLLLFGVVWLEVRSVRHRRSVLVTLRLPAADIPVGADQELRVVLTNRGRSPLVGLVVEEPGRRFTLTRPGLSGSRAPAGPVPAGRWWQRRPGPDAQPVPVIGSGDSWTMALPLPTGSRGLLGLAPVRVWTTDPLRLFAWWAAASPPAHLVIHPVPIPASLPAGFAAGELDATATPERPALPQRGVAGEELSDLRPYQPGDHLNRLHWPSMAGRGELLVRDFLPAAPGQLTLMVDLRPASYRGTTLDAVAATAAGLGLSALRRGLVVDLCTSAGDRAPIPASGLGPAMLLRALALLDPAERRPSVRTGGSPSRADRGPTLLVTSPAGRDEALVTGRGTVQTVVAR